MSKGLGVGLGIGNRGVIPVIDALLARAQIAGRDGTVTESRGTERTSIFDGSIKAAGVPVQGAMRIGNRLIPCFAAFSQVTQQCRNTAPIQQNGTVSNIAAFVSDFSAIRYIGNGSVDWHRVSYSPSAHTVGPMCLSAYVRAVGATTTCALSTWDNGTSEIVGEFNLSTGIATFGGDGTAAGIVPMGGGIFRVWVSGPIVGTGVGDIAIYATPFKYMVAMNGIDGLDACGVQLESGSRPTPYVPQGATAVTHNSDVLTWAPPISPNDDPGEFLVLASPYSSTLEQSASVGAVMFDMISGSGEIGTIYASTDGLHFNRCTLSAGNNITALVPTVMQGTVASFALRAGATEEAFINGVSVGSVGAPNRPYASSSTISVGSNRVTSAQFGGAVALLYVPGGITPSERAALETHRQKSMVFV